MCISHHFSKIDSVIWFILVPFQICSLLQIVSAVLAKFSGFVSNFTRRSPDGGVPRAGAASLRPPGGGRRGHDHRVPAAGAVAGHARGLRRRGRRELRRLHRRPRVAREGDFRVRGRNRNDSICRSREPSLISTEFGKRQIPVKYSQTQCCMPGKFCK